MSNLESLRNKVIKRLRRFQPAGIQVNGYDLSAKFESAAETQEAFFAVCNIRHVDAFAIENRLTVYFDVD